MLLSRKLNKNRCFVCMSWLVNAYYMKIASVQYFLSMIYNLINW